MEALIAKRKIQGIVQIRKTNMIKIQLSMLAEGRRMRDLKIKKMISEDIKKEDEDEKELNNELSLQRERIRIRQAHIKLKREREKIREEKREMINEKRKMKRKMLSQVSDEERKQGVVYSFRYGKETARQLKRRKLYQEQRYYNYIVSRAIENNDSLKRERLRKEKEFRSCEINETQFKEWKEEFEEEAKRCYNERESDKKGSQIMWEDGGWWVG